MFSIMKRYTTNGSSVHKWFQIWESEDGDDCALYLKQCVDSDRVNEYKMLFIVKE